MKCLPPGRRGVSEGCQRGWLSLTNPVECILLNLPSQSCCSDFVSLFEVSTSPEAQIGGVLGTMKPGMKLLGEANAVFDQVAYDPKTKA